MRATKATLAIILAIIVVVALSIGAWQLNWFVAAKNTDKTTQIIDASLGHQDALRTKILENIRQVTGPGVPDVQKTQINGEICDAAGQLTGKVKLPQAAITYIAQECNQS